MITQDPLPKALELIGCALVGDPESNATYRAQIDAGLCGEAYPLLSPFHDLWEQIVSLDGPLEMANLFARVPQYRTETTRILSAADSVAPPAWPDYLAALRRQRLESDTLLELEKIRVAVTDGAEPAPMLARALETAERLGAQAKPKRTRRDMLRGFFDDLERRKQLDAAGKFTGIPTGIGGLDGILDGLQFGEFSVLGARPSVGKTAAAISIICNACLVEKLPTVFVSLESTSAAIMRRMAACLTGASALDLRHGRVHRWESHLARFNAAFEAAPLTMLDHAHNPGVTTVDGAIAEARAAIRNEGVRLVIVDYLQKFKGGGEHEEHRLEVAEVSEKFARLAHQTGAHVMALAQLRRDSEGKMPTLSDLAECGHIERDADVVLLLHREDRRSEEAEIIVAKQRDGELDSIPVRFDLKRQRFEGAPREKPDRDAK
ncbi:MAG: AAA family ATPase [Verrucomicrobia bacterium]|nr:MAG: AAA family ATPase [Verrucomicrobiota bacterium]